MATPAVMAQNRAPLLRLANAASSQSGDCSGPEDEMVILVFRLGSCPSCSAWYFLAPVLPISVAQPSRQGIPVCCGSVIFASGRFRAAPRVMVGAAQAGWACCQLVEGEALGVYFCPKSRALGYSQGDLYMHAKTEDTETAWRRLRLFSSHSAFNYSSASSTCASRPPTFSPSRDGCSLR